MYKPLSLSSMHPLTTPCKPFPLTSMHPRTTLMSGMQLLLSVTPHKSSPLKSVPSTTEPTSGMVVVPVTPCQPISPTSMPSKTRLMPGMIVASVTPYKPLLLTSILTRTKLDARYGALVPMTPVKLCYCNPFVVLLLSSVVRKKDYAGHGLHVGA